MSRLLRSTAFRTGLLYAALFAVSVVILFAIVYWQTAGSMDRELRSLVTSDMDSLMAHYRDDGVSGLKGAIDDRLTAQGSHTTWYLLRAANGRVLAGNLPPQSLHAGWQRILVKAADGGVEEADEGEPVLGLGRRLHAAGFLFVAHDAQQLADMRERLLYALLWSLGLTLVLAAAGGAIAGARTLRRVEVINRVAGDIVRGDFVQRIPTRGRGDEFDILAGHLNRMFARIQQLLEAMRQVSTDIAHDLRTPLGRLRQGLESARRDATSVAEYQVAVDQAIQHTDQILETFGALLRIAQIESGSRQARFAAVDLSAELHALVEIYAPVAEERGQRIVADIASGLVIRGDRELLVQAVVNLIENALMHTPDDTRVDVRLAAHVGRISLVVSDHGPGIPPEAIKRVTQRFYRVESSRSTPGNGLGLSLVAAVVELHGAILELRDNRPGLRVEMTFAATEPGSARPA